MHRTEEITLAMAAKDAREGEEWEHRLPGKGKSEHRLPGKRKSEHRLPGKGKSEHRLQGKGRSEHRLPGMGKSEVARESEHVRSWKEGNKNRSSYEHCVTFSPSTHWAKNIRGLV